MPVAADDDIVAVKVMFCPTVDGLALEETTVVLLALFTVSDRAAEKLPKYLLSPL